MDEQGTDSKLFASLQIWCCKTTKDTAHAIRKAMCILVVSSHPAHSTSGQCPVKNPTLAETVPNCNAHSGRYFLFLKERWRDTARSRSEMLESHIREAPIQNYNSDIDLIVHLPSRLVCVNRSEGPVLSCTNCATSHKRFLMAVRFTFEGTLSIQCPSLQSVSDSPYFHEMHRSYRATRLEGFSF